jgi:hypothetical protein
VLALAAYLGLTGIACPQAREPKEVAKVKSPIQMEVKFQADEQSLKVSYTVINGSSEPVLVLDRMWDRKAKALNPNWAYVDVRGNRALIKRVMDPKPLKMVVEHPRVPYGRKVLPGERLKGEFALSLPLTAFGQYDFFLKPNAVLEDVELVEVGFMLAWTTVPAEPLPPQMQKVEIAGEELQPISYHVLEGAQRFLTSEPQKVKVAGKAKTVPPA